MPSMSSTWPFFVFSYPLVSAIVSAGVHLICVLCPLMSNHVQATDLMFSPCSPYFPSCPSHGPSMSFLEPSSFPCARSYPFHAPSMPHVSAMSAYVSSCLSYGSSCGFRGCPFSMCMRCPYEIGRDSWVRGGQVSVVLKNSPLNGGRSSHRMHMEHKRKRSVPWVG